MNLSRCGLLTTAPETGVWYRVIWTRFLPTALSVVHTSTVPSRFSDGTSAMPKHQLLYLSEDTTVALFEAQALFGSLAAPGGILPNPARSWTILNVMVSLSTVADLTDVGAQTLLDTTVQELTGDWSGYQLRGSMGGSVPLPMGSAPTQQLGDALFGVSKLEGFRVVSAKVPWRQNLVVFPQNLQPGSSVEWWNPATRTMERL